MTDMEKKRMVKLVAGSAVYTLATLKTRSILDKKIQRQPHKDIAIQLNSTFWAICLILYNYHMKKE